MNARRKNKNRRWIPVLVGIVVAIGLFFAFRIFGPNTGGFSKGEFLYIPTGATYEDVKTALKEGEFVRDISSFDMLAKRADYPARIKAGKYQVKKGMSNYDIVRLLRSGRQVPVKLVINKLRTKQDLVHSIATNLEADSNVLWQMFRDTVYLSQFGLDTHTVMCAIIPDTYEFWWNTNADKAFRKLEKYYAEYWNKERKQKADSLGLSPQDVTILASIVEEETNKHDEKGNIASVYINRLNKGMPLQADPTVKFAVNDFSIKRVTGHHLKQESPYNTYTNTGLPPGPICTPSKRTLEAVLNSPKTDYIYFCAKEDFSGYHRFSSSYSEHIKNARAYQQALNARGIH